MTDSRPDPITAYDRLGWSDDAVEAMLVRGEHRRELIATFGADLHAALAALARKAAAIDPESAPRVWLLPGIMGSRLGRLRTADEPADTLWLDPLDIIGGRLRELTLDGAGAGLQSLGMLQFSYLHFKLQLKSAGLAVRVFDYDWRRSVAELGATFAEALEQDARPAAVVAHSMGGLVARHALSQREFPGISRIVLLGTPNNGSWATVMALRGSYSVVRRLAQLDRSHDAEALAAGVFHSFDSLYDLMPAATTAGQLLRDSEGWPSQGLRPADVRLQAARDREQKLPAGDARYACIVGHGKPTVISAHAGNEYSYGVSLDGDGTVSTTAAELTDSACYYTACGHSDLVREPGIGEAVIDLLRHGSTQRLSIARPTPSAIWQITDTQLHALYHGKIDWASLSIEERRIFLDSLNESLPQPQE